MLASDNAADWVAISEMLLGPAPQVGPPAWPAVPAACLEPAWSLSRRRAACSTGWGRMPCVQLGGARSEDTHRMAPVRSRSCLPLPAWQLHEGPPGGYLFPLLAPSWCHPLRAPVLLAPYFEQICNVLPFPGPAGLCVLSEAQGKQLRAAGGRRPGGRGGGWGGGARGRCGRRSGWQPSRAGGRRGRGVLKPAPRIHLLTIHVAVLAVVRALSPACGASCFHGCS